MSKTFVMGDIHGAYKALLQCIKRSGIDKENDTLICLGDVCDGWSEVYECVEELSTFKNLIMIKGNHDVWFIEWLMRGIHPCGWLKGGYATLLSYIKYADRDVETYATNEAWESTLTYIDIPPHHQKLLLNANNYYIDDKNRCFVHGGFNRHANIKETPNHVYYWDRDLWYAALSNNNRTDKAKYPFKIKDNFTKVFIGHTATINWDTDKPIFARPVINLDTGAGFKGKLTIMNVDTEEYWQSDLVNELYKDERGRN